MRIARLVLLGLVLLAAFTMWRGQLWLVQRPGDGPHALALRPVAERRRVAFDVALPSIPEGVSRLRAGDGVLVVHYWAPWELNGGAQSAALDSLHRQDDMVRAHVALVTFDPFPSVARYVRRHRLKLPVLLDHQRALVSQLPCPSLPYTYVLDAQGRVAIEAAGEVDWFAPQTRRVLRALQDERGPEPALDVPPAAPAARRATGSAS